MSETLKEALQYAARDSLWLDSPRYQHRYIKALAAEVVQMHGRIEQLQETLRVKEVLFQDGLIAAVALAGKLQTELTELHELRDTKASERSLTLQKWGPKTANHPSVGTKCAACDLLFQPGDYTTAISMGPGDDKEARKAAQNGASYNAIALEVHWGCATGEE